MRGWAFVGRSPQAAACLAGEAPGFATFASVSLTLRVLFTAFEPSGDLLAARMTHALLRRDPSIEVIALGGDALREAGAEIIQDTIAHGSMGLDAISQIKQHRAVMRKLSEVLAAKPLDAALPVDSPAANWSVCKLVRRHHPRAKIVHLVMPQLWAWASWRVHRLKRLTDHVLCLLPFEVDWLQRHRIAGTFVGHPLFEEDAQDALESLLPQFLIEASHPRVAVLPGSRGAELHRNLPHFVNVIQAVRAEHAGMTAVLGVRTEQDALACREILKGLTQGPDFEIVVGQTDAVIRWADAALTKSGTVTLQIAARGTPMVAVYNHSRLQWHGIGRWIIATRTFTLPNLISEHQGRGRVIPEFVPHFGEVPSVARALSALMSDTSARSAQREGFERIAGVFESATFTRDAVDAFERVMAS